MKVKPRKRRPFPTWTTAHKDVTERLPFIDPALAEQVRKILEKNLSERHIRGGESTKRMYAAKRGEGK